MFLIIIHYIISVLNDSLVRPAHGIVVSNCVYLGVRKPQETLDKV